MYLVTRDLNSFRKACHLASIIGKVCGFGLNLLPIKSSVYILRFSDLPSNLASCHDSFSSYLSSRTMHRTKC